MRTNKGQPDQLYFLRPDVLLQRPAELVGAARAFDFSETDWVLSCPNIRARSKVISDRIRRLLQPFRQGAKISAAILALARDEQTEPRELLRQFLPILQDLAQWGYLCLENELPASSPKSVELPPAAAGYLTQQILKRSSALIVLRALSVSGETVCVKRLVESEEPIERAKILNEAAMLKRLAGLSVPRIVDFSPTDSECALVTSWAGGISSRDAFAGELGPGVVIETRHSLKLAARILRIFEQIHARGILHSDVHYHNVRYQTDGACQVIDFGLSFEAASAAAAEPLREAATHFLAPEQLPREHGKSYRRPDFQSEQYSLGALLHFLLSGRHYLDFRLEAMEMIEQIRTARPRPLTLRNGESVPSVETILGRALAKEPGERYESVAAFADAFEAAANAAAPRMGGRNQNAATSPSLEVLRPERALHCRCEDFGIVGSLNNALAALALASAHEQPALLEGAVIWAGHARRLRQDSGTMRTEIARSAALPVPLFVGAVCLHELPLIIDLGLAIVRTALGEKVALDEKLLAELEEEARQESRWDFTTGHAALLHALSGFGQFGFVPEGVTELGEKICRMLVARLETFPLSRNSLPALAMAHGLAGVWYAVLQWWSIRNAAVPDRTAELFRRYCASLPIDRLRVANEAETGKSVSWWCNGLSGIVGLIALPNAPLPMSEKRVLAYGVAEIVEQHVPAVEHICCGKAGHALALVQAFRLTDDERFRETAALALRGTTEIRRGNDDGSILKGRLGIALVSEALEAAAPLYVPFFGKL